MFRGPYSCNGTDVWENRSLFRVNDFGDPNPHPRYQGWLWLEKSGSFVDLFRFNFEGTFETHRFASWSGDTTSPLGAPHFFSSGISEGGMKCNQGD